MKRGGRNLVIAVGIVLIVTGALLLFFQIPFSPLQSRFAADRNRLEQNTGPAGSGIFSEADLQGLPTPVKNYFRYCKWIGTPKMSQMEAEYQNVSFRQGRTGPTLKINYLQENFVSRPERVALITSSKFGVPFDGYDSFLDGKGGMKGVLGKLVTIFDQTGKEMDRAALATFLSECLLVPNAALQSYIRWEGIDDTHARATISCYGISVQGTFTFSGAGEMLSFNTEDRPLYNTDGSIEHVPWSAVCSGYKEQNGHLLPTEFQAVWHYDSGDFIYFDGNNIRLRYT